MENKTDMLPDNFREVVFDNDETVPEDIQEIRNKNTIVFYSQMIEYADTQKELWDLMSDFIKIHKHNLDKLGDVFDKFFEKIEGDLD